MTVLLCDDIIYNFVCIKQQNRLSLILAQRMSKYQKIIKAAISELFLRPRPFGIVESSYYKDQWLSYDRYLWDKMLRRWKRSDNPFCSLCNTSKKQTPKHVLSNCSAVSSLSRYTSRHNAILEILASWFLSVLSGEHTLFVWI